MLKAVVDNWLIKEKELKILEIKVALRIKLFLGQFMMHLLFGKTRQIQFLSQEEG